MKTKQKIAIISIIISIIVISSITILNPQLIDRAFYRMGLQEQICFPIINEEFQSNNVTNIVAAGDFGINENSVKTLKNIQSSNGKKEDNVLSPQDLSFQEERRKRKVRKLDFEIR